MKNVLIEKNESLTNAEKDLFAYFGEGAKIRPPLRILNPKNIYIGDYTSIRENCYIHSYIDNSAFMDHIENKYKKDFKKADYLYNSKIHFDREIQIGRGALISCTKKIILERNVLLSENIFIGDNNHTFTHPDVPIMQQPNKPGDEVLIGRGSWIGFGAVILAGTKIGFNSVVGANAVVQGEYPAHAVIGPEKATLLFKRH